MASERSRLSRFTIAMCALRGLVRTRLFGDVVLFNERDVAELAARGGERPAA